MQRERERETFRELTGQRSQQLNESEGAKRPQKGRVPWECNENRNTENNAGTAA